MERPIILKAHEVRGILDGRQTQLRRALRAQPPAAYHFHEYVNWPPDSISARFEDPNNMFTVACPWGKVGDRLWVRETFGLMSYDQGDEAKTDVIYRQGAYFLESDGKTSTEEPILNSDLDGGRWRQSNHMSRWESRILLEIVEVRVARLQDISCAEARACGVIDEEWDEWREDVSCIAPPGSKIENERDVFFKDFEPDIWNANPWVWVIEFKRVNS